MAFKIIFDDKCKFLTVVAAQKFTTEEYETTIKEIIASDRYPSNINTLWDLRSLDFNLMNKDLTDKLVELRNNYPQRGYARIAILVSNSVGLAMARMFQGLSGLKDVPQTFNSFIEYDEAADWLCKK